MRIPPVPYNEAERLQELRDLHLLDTEREERFDRITRLAKRLFGVPTVLISLVDDQRQWFKSAQGLDACETPREVSFCAHAILKDAPLIVEDAGNDPRFARNPLVLEAPHIRAYLGIPLRGPRGYQVGTLCLIDYTPRRFEAEDIAALYDLRLMVEAEFKLREQSQVVVRARLNEARLETTTRLQDAILSNTAVSVIATDLAGRIKVFSKGAELLLGYRSANVIGTLTLDEVIDPRNTDVDPGRRSVAAGRALPSDFAALAEACRQGGVEGEWDCVHLDGHRVPVSMSVSGIFTHNWTLAGLVCVASVAPVTSAPRQRRHEHSA